VILNLNIVHTGAMLEKEPVERPRIETAFSFIFKICKGSNFFHDLKRRHPNGKFLANQLDKLIHIKCKIVKAKCLIQFLEECIKNGIYTTHLRDRVRRNRLKPSSEVCERFLQVELTSAREQLKQLIALNLSKTAVLDTLNWSYWCRFVRCCSDIIRSLRSKEAKKFEGILSSCAPLMGKADYAKHVTNLSSRSLSTTEVQALSMGLKFCIPPKNVPRVQLETEIENAFLQLKELFMRKAVDISTTKNSLVHLANCYRRTPIEKGGLQPAHLQALRDLHQDVSIVVLKPDKGDGVVVMDRSTYNTKLKDVIDGTGKFSQCLQQNDQTSDLEDELSVTLDHLINSGHVTKQTKSELIQPGSSIPRLYGLPKTHKTSLSMRPILSMVGSASHRTARWLADLLGPVRAFYGERSLRDSFEFVDLIHKTDVTDSKLLSFDVESLFTNVPVKETIDVIISTIQREKMNIGIPLNILRHLLELCTLNVQFLFNGVYYRQVEGCAMGSCLGPVLADIFMGYLESRLKSKIDGTCKVYKRYVDDCFLVVSNEVDVSLLLDAFNKAHENIKFTLEEEKAGRLPFLDVLCMREENGTVRTRIYRKTTWTGLYMSFFSFCPRKYKAALIKTLAHRARRICSPEWLETEINLVRECLISNGYPPFFVERYLNCPPIKDTDPISVAEKKKIFMKIPYIGENGTKFFMQSFRKILRDFPAAEAKVVFSTQRIPVPPLKDRMPLTAQCNVIYSFVCSCGSSYIGRTKRRLQERIKEHLPKWLCQGKRRPRATNPPASSITRHLMEKQCGADRAASAFRVLHRTGASPLKQRIAEALYIKRKKPDLCIQKENVLTLHLPW
jgi:hypothetical protein